MNLKRLFILYVVVLVLTLSASIQAEKAGWWSPDVTNLVAIGIMLVFIPLAVRLMPEWHNPRRP